jgi:hypothetical protein
MQLNYFISVMRSHKDNFTSLSKSLGIARQSLYNKLRGITPFTIDEIRRIAVRYGLTPEEIEKIFL